MSQEFSMRVIARIHSDFSTKFGVPRQSGLVDALQVLKGIDGIAQVYFSEKDVVRHRLVQDIVKAYEQAAQSRLENGRRHMTRLAGTQTDPAQTSDL